MKDNFSRQADAYARYRPTYPAALFDFIAGCTTNNDTAWDCATGNGQTAIELAKRFKTVYATDSSRRQLDNAIIAENILYSQQPAEETSFADNSFDLITVSQALHWFQFDRFYAEVNRVARPGAILAVWSYSLLQIDPAIDALIREYHFETLKNYWDNERHFVDEEYKTIPFPFAQLPAPPFEIKTVWTLAGLEGYLHTWSALQKFILDRKYNPVKALIEQISQHWKGDTMTVTFPLHLKIARIEKPGL